MQISHPSKLTKYGLKLKSDYFVASLPSSELLASKEHNNYLL